jgi:hypothetical protein
MLSVFYIVLGDPKNRITVSEIFPQIDQILPRDSSIKDFWKDDKSESSIWIEVFEGKNEIQQIGIRFDTESPNENFTKSMIDFATRNNFLITVKQEISFHPDLLSQEIINKNLKRWTLVESPKEYFEHQKSYFISQISID